MIAGSLIVTAHVVPVVTFHLHARCYRCLVTLRFALPAFILRSHVYGFSFVDLHFDFTLPRCSIHSRYTFVTVTGYRCYVCRTTPLRGSCRYTTLPPAPLSLVVGCAYTTRHRTLPHVLFTYVTDAFRSRVYGSGFTVAYHGLDFARLDSLLVGYFRFTPGLYAPRYGYTVTSRCVGPAADAHRTLLPRTRCTAPAHRTPYLRLPPHRDSRPPPLRYHTCYTFTLTLHALPTVTFAAYHTYYRTRRIPRTPPLPVHTPHHTTLPHTHAFPVVR